LTAFLGYVLPYGQMSLWGYNKCLICLKYKILRLKNKLCIYLIMPLYRKIGCKYKGAQRIGPHNNDII
jgi:hypothetical protein